MLELAGFPLCPNASPFLSQLMVEAPGVVELRSLVVPVPLTAIEGVAGNDKALTITWSVFVQPVAVFVTVRV